LKTIQVVYVIENFSKKFCGGVIPASSAFHYLVNESKTTSLVLVKKIKRCHEEKLDDVGARLEHSPRKSLAKLAQQAGVLVF
jgi:hypothetical protein